VQIVKYMVMPPGQGHAPHSTKDVISWHSEIQCLLIGFSPQPMSPGHGTKYQITSTHLQLLTTTLLDGQLWDDNMPAGRGTNQHHTQPMQTTHLPQQHEPHSNKYGQVPTHQLVLTTMAGSASP
jgi:hypothetical protein